MEWPQQSQGSISLSCRSVPGSVTCITVGRRIIMTACAAGQILCGSEGRVHVRIRGEMHYIIAEELGYLFFVGERVPLMKNAASPHENPKEVGSVYLSRSGRAVIIAVGNQRYMLPRDKFLAVALGEDVSCIFFEAPGNEPEIEIISPRKGGDAS